MRQHTTTLLLITLIAAPAAGRVGGAAEPAASATAWNDGHPARGLHHAGALVGKFKEQAGRLGRDEKVRVLIIGDSLSDGYQHWSHHFRRDLQAAYGNGGPGNIWATWKGNARSGWLFDAADFTQETTGRWRSGWGARGDVWPYLGWNGDFLATQAADASYRLEATGSRFTVVTSSGTFTTFDGRPISNRAAGFTARLDGQVRSVRPARVDEPLDIELTRFEVPAGRHALQVDSIHDGTLALHGVLVENSEPGVVVNNISRGGYWAYNYLWRQPGWEKILAAMDPDLTIIFLTKPESGGSGGDDDGPGRAHEHKALRERVARAVPRSDLLIVIGWLPRDGQSPADARSMADRVAWCEADRLPYLDLSGGLDSRKMQELDWFADNIHLAPAGGKAIGDGIARLFLPGP